MSDDIPPPYNTVQPPLSNEEQMETNPVSTAGKGDIDPASYAIKAHSHSATINDIPPPYETVQSSLSDEVQNNTNPTNEVLANDTAKIVEDIPAHEARAGRKAEGSDKVDYS